jgi:hypothetical protein
MVRIVAGNGRGNDASPMVDEPLPVAGIVAGLMRGNDAQSTVLRRLRWIA